CARGLLKGYYAMDFW
nr:immunoglobulin heavy chain junction region [Mus musculus]MBK4184734.1 immunoglobulin heavy chain junction region [Mus musculus]MBK4184735.1 immunoglobulin heavy chain junction region [Mus musculus]MBK4184736.1 immunoglobulin heavy chain junction region [Mus musculus]MBK4184752.1 immunoglobulin heavy chain junction region [Mus musculus]